MTSALVRTPSSRWLRSRRRSTWSALALAALAAAAPAAAQQPAVPAAGPLVTGKVVDSGNGQPLGYALISTEDGKPLVLTDSVGVFRINTLPPGVHNLTASQLGYSRLTLPVVIAEGMVPVEFKLFPDPIALEGIEVMGDRFRGRRNALAAPATGYGVERLQRTAAGTVMDFLELEAKLSGAICPGRVAVRGCFNRRGQVVVPEVFLDEAPLVGGLSQLEGYNPRDLYLVEVIGNGLMIRAYTHGFMDRMSRNPRALEPIILR